MASTSFQSPDVGLWGQPEITKPEPLRIIKGRANTITGCSTSKEIPISRRGSTGQPDIRDSSPDGPNRSLTIFKRRGNRGSVRSGSLECNPTEGSHLPTTKHATQLDTLIRHTNSDAHIVRQLSSRTTSIGSFLKSELFRKGSENEASVYSSSVVRKGDGNTPLNPLDKESPPPLTLANLDLEEQKVSVTPRRRQSIGGKIVSKAFDGLGNARSKSLHFLRSKSEKDSLLRKISFRHVESNRLVSSEMTSRNSSRFSFEQDSLFFSQSGPSSVLLPTAVELLSKSSFILYPEISVIPEVDSIDIEEEASIWVAVIVTGVLRKTSSCESTPDTISNLKGCNTSQDESTSENSDYGHLYSVEISLSARKGCVLESVIAEYSKTRRLHLGQTELTLAKVNLLAGRRKFSHARESSKELFAELESRLGDATTEYLTIGVSYKHSAFSTSRNSIVAPKGLSYQATVTKIEAHATIKRHCSQSSWSQQANENQNSTIFPNSLLSSINAHCDSITAAKIRGKIASETVSLKDLNQEVEANCRLYSSSDTIMPVKEESLRDLLHQMENSTSTSLPKESLDVTQARFRDIESNLGIVSLNPCAGLDPARKIWSDMRKTSRGNSKHGSRASESLETAINDIVDGRSEIEAKMQKEQARIMELALRNKRSLGADTLRSMVAPSISMGLGMGRGWGWGPPWW